MSDKKMLMPAEVAEYTVKAGIKKANTPTKQVLASAFLAGAYIAFGALGSIAAAYNLLANPATYGLGKMVAGLMFPAGLMFVLVAGADLFTGNILVTLAALKKKVTWGQTFKNWALVWIGNLVGAVLVAYLVSLSGVFDWSNGLYGGVVVKTAVGKLGYTWVAAIASGILCNWIVCATVWMTYAAKDVAGKLLAGFFGIFLFVCAGFEHSVANMGYLFAGFFSKSNPAFLEAAHKTAADAAVINLPNIFVNNLIPVTIGNILGGAVFVAGVYYFIFLNNKEENSAQEKKAA
ncbi:formate/nitrite transporter family protein [Romboutsia lituseburensis]|uniref:Formate/nitrite transporter n=1 Tax=Romboutsia lituseburensis DSM 797 TaxID=1121325 RepID=A0A1G9RJ69_9FIRM|nr:formate/nitrite transporter family protein [Romboutsia lituseburensis]CEH32731.1 Formate/nitrite transporter [Romboutsia lituseburensis]SDM23352.1 formate/nitrite transporter [Romboutsia lituseburensis DSM 797]